jgi:hypothetical protein
MFAVVNHLPFKDDVDWSVVAAKFNAFVEKIKPDHPQLRTAVIVRAGPAEAIFIGLYGDKETMEHVSSKVAAPWFADNIRQYLAGPAARSVGEIIAGSP